MITTIAEAEAVAARTTKTVAAAEAAATTTKTKQQQQQQQYQQQQQLPFADTRNLARAPAQPVAVVNLCFRHHPANPLQPAVLPPGPDLCDHDPDEHVRPPALLVPDRGRGHGHQRVIAVGLCVDFSAHVAHTFMTCT